MSDSLLSGRRLVKSDSAALASLAKATTEVQSRLKELAAIRQGASQQTLTVAEEVAYYTRTIASLVSAMGVGVDFSRDRCCQQSRDSF